MEVAPLAFSWKCGYHLCAMSTFVEHLHEHRGATARIAREMGVTHAAVRQWRTNGIPAERVLRLEELTGIPRHVLRPDIYPAPARRAAA